MLDMILADEKSLNILLDKIERRVQSAIERALCHNGVIPHLWMPRNGSAQVKCSRCGYLASVSEAFPNV